MKPASIYVTLVLAAKRPLLFLYLDYNFCNKVPPIGNTCYHIYDLDTKRLHDVSVDKFKKLSDVLKNDDLKIKNKSIVKADVVFYVSSKNYAK